jgi:hypothetical protein
VLEGQAAGGGGGLNSPGFQEVCGLYSVSNREPVRICEQGGGLVSAQSPNCLETMLDQAGSLLHGILGHMVGNAL